MQDDRELAQRSRPRSTSPPPKRRRTFDNQYYGERDAEGFKRRKEELDDPNYHFTTEKAQYFSELFKDLPYENKQSWELQVKYKARMQYMKKLNRK